MGPNRDRRADLGMSRPVGELWITRNSSYDTNFACDASSPLYCRMASYHEAIGNCMNQIYNHAAETPTYVIGSHGMALDSHQQILHELTAPSTG